MRHAKVRVHHTHAHTHTRTRTNTHTKANTVKQSMSATIPQCMRLFRSLPLYLQLLYPLRRSFLPLSRSSLRIRYRDTNMCPVDAHRTKGQREAAWTRKPKAFLRDKPSACLAPRDARADATTPWPGKRRTAHKTWAGSTSATTMHQYDNAAPYRAAHQHPRLAGAGAARRTTCAGAERSTPSQGAHCEARAARCRAWRPRA